MKFSILHGGPKQPASIISEGILGTVLDVALATGILATRIIRSLGSATVWFLTEMGKDPSKAFHNIKRKTRQQYENGNIDEKQYTSVKEAIEAAEEFFNNPKYGDYFKERIKHHGIRLGIENKEASNMTAEEQESARIKLSIQSIQLAIKDMHNLTKNSHNVTPLKSDHQYVTIKDEEDDEIYVIVNYNATTGMAIIVGQENAEDRTISLNSLEHAGLSFDEDEDEDEANEAEIKDEPQPSKVEDESARQPVFDGKTLIKYYSGNTRETYDIPEGVTHIGENAFENCTNLKEMVIPSSVTDIGAGAFSGCSNLEMVSLPPNVNVHPTAFTDIPQNASVFIRQSPNKS